MLTFKHRTYKSTIMKRILYFPILFMLISFFSCQDLEEEAKGKLSSEGYFNTIEDLDAAVIGMFRPLGKSWSGLTTGDSYCGLYGADDITTHPASNKEAYREFDLFNASTSNEWFIAGLWQPMYKALYAINTVIANYSSVDAEENLKNKAVGQAFFLRAFCNFQLVRMFGDIPLPTEPIPDELMFRTPVAEVYSLIVEDLLKAEQYLPTTWSDAGRPTSGAAKALLANVYITMAGWPLKEEANYAKAAIKAQEVMGMGYQLMENYADLWKVSNNNNIESIFALQCDESLGFSNHICGESGQPEAEEGGWDDYFSEITFFNEFPEGLRKDATFYTVFKKRGPNGTIIDVPWQESLQNNPYYAKFRDETFDEANPFKYDDGSSLNITFIRFAEILLTYAEAKCMANNGPDQSAYDAINRVRTRAGLPDLTPNLSMSAFRDAVIAEKGWEFAAERIRWFDLIRTEKLEEVTAKRSPEDLPLIKNPTKKNYLAPIPANDIMINPNLTQNPGY
jgi:hypothetical protein